MKRDLEPVRIILPEIAQPSGQPIFGAELEGKSDAKVLEHISLWIEAGLDYAALTDQITQVERGATLYGL